jgi:hypothetical protein
VNAKSTELWIIQNPSIIYKWVFEKNLNNGDQYFIELAAEHNSGFKKVKCNISKNHNISKSHAKEVRR